MSNQFDKKSLNDILDAANKSGKLGENGEKLKSALNSGSFDNVLKNMKSSDAQKLNSLLKDKEAAQKLLSTPQAQQILKKLLESK